MSSSLLTSVTLLGRLGGDVTDQVAWAQFVERYGKRVLQWCSRWGLQGADAEDVCQDVLVRVAKQMRNFRYESGKSFRGWLKSVARGAWSDWTESGQRLRGATGNSESWQPLTSISARDDLIAEMESEFDLELFQYAIAKIRLRVQPATWLAFQLTAIDGRSGTEAAALTGMKTTAVFVARSRVLKMLTEEVRSLEHKS